MFQFAHIESYSRKTPKTGKSGGHSVSSIVNEAIREVNCVPHVANPQPPKYIYGKPLDILEATCDEWADSIKDAAGHKTRKDALCLLAGVVSAPAEIEPEAWGKLKVDTLLWLHKKYGDRLQTVVEHTDEANPHLHFYCVPLPGERFDQIHDGKRAAAALKGEPKGKQNAAYRRAMRGWQDEYSVEVGMPNGMVRFGPRRRRVSREGWIQEQALAKSIAASLANSKELRATAEREATNVTREARREIGRIEREAIAKGEAKGARLFSQKSLFGKLSDLVTGLKQENRELRAKLGRSETRAKSWYEKAKLYREKGIGLLRRLEFIKPKYREMERNLEGFDGLRLELDSKRRALEDAQNDLQKSRAGKLHLEALVEMYQREEEVRENAKRERMGRERGLELERNSVKPKGRKLSWEDSSLDL